MNDPAWLASLAARVLDRCDRVAAFTERPGAITRTFLSPAFREAIDAVGGWMRAAGMAVRVDEGGNLVGRFPGETADAPALLIGSHLDTVPDGGKYDGALGVLLGLAAVEALGGRPLPFAIEVVGFAEEEGVRYRSPYLGSLAFVGRFDRSLLDRSDASGIAMADAYRSFGLDPDRIDRAAQDPERYLGYLEAHIEQGPVLESEGLSVAVVDAIAGQSRLTLAFEGKAAHAGTEPMRSRRDALAAAAEFVLAVERHAGSVAGLVGTVGTIAVAPGAGNVVPGSARLSLDLRHADDAARESALASLLDEAGRLANRRGILFQVEHSEHHPAVPADLELSNLLATAIEDAGQPARRLVSGAGHDAAVLALFTPMALLFLRSPGGVSHHPDEKIIVEDVQVSLDVLLRFLGRLASRDD